MHSDKLHIHLYEEIVNGNFHPARTRFSGPEVCKNLVTLVNIIKEKTLPAKESLEYIENIDFARYGFKSATDFDVKFKDISGDRQEIFLVPGKTYELSESMDIPIFNEFKSKCFLVLIGDEFERIKVKANKYLQETEYTEKLKLYTVRHIQTAKKLLHDVKLQLLLCQDKRTE